MPRLEIVDGPEKGKVFAIQREETVIGRVAYCDVVLAQKNISRQHARVVRSGTDFFLEDMPRQIDVLQKFLEAGNAQGAERQAHTIKGSSANLGCEGLCSAALTIEKAVKAGDLGRAAEELRNLRMQFDSSRAAICREFH